MQIHEHRSELGHWRMAQRRADPQLRAFAHGYLASSSFLPRAVEERRLPSAEIPLILNFGAPHRRLDGAGPQDWVDRTGAWIEGLHDGPRLSEAVGDRDFMVVRLTPLGAHHLLRTPMHPISGRAVDLEALDAKLARRVMSRVGAARTWSERFDAVEALIAERVAQVAVPGGLALAWRKLEAADGRLALGPLASQTGCSHRTLIARFRTQIGATPKAVARLLRFDRAVRRLSGPSGAPYIERRGPDDRSAPPPPWADLAADCGFFDQSHFITEFRHFAGTTPADFVRRLSNAV